MRVLLLVATLLLGCLVRAAVPVSDRLENGLRLVTQPTTASQVVSVVALIDYSALDEPPMFAGLRQVLLTSMLQGSEAVDGGTLRQMLAASGATLDGRIHQDVMELSLSLPADALSSGLDALAEILCRPQLADDSIKLAIDYTRLRALTPPAGAYETATRLAPRLLYAGHPYATRGLGTEESLWNISPATVRAAYQQYVTPGAVVIAVAGRCTPAQVREQVKAHFATWEARRQAPHLTVEAPGLTESRVELREEPVKSTCVMLAFPVCGATHHDFITLRVIDALLGGGTGARLFRSVREQRHLAYEVATSLPGQAAGSYFSLYALTHSSYMEETRVAMVNELTRLQTDTVAPQELKRAKAYLKGRYLIGHQYSAQHAFDLAWYETVGLDADFDAAFTAKVDAVTAEDVQRVARTYFTRYQIIVIVPFAVDRAPLAYAGLSRQLSGVQDR